LIEKSLELLKPGGIFALHLPQKDIRLTSAKTGTRFTKKGARFNLITLLYQYIDCLNNDGQNIREIAQGRYAQTNGNSEKIIIFLKDNIKATILMAPSDVLDIEEKQNITGFKQGFFNKRDIENSSGSQAAEPSFKKLRLTCEQS
jgi:hypothetical protein